MSKVTDQGMPGSSPQEGGEKGGPSLIALSQIGGRKHKLTNKHQGRKKSKYPKVSRICSRQRRKKLISDLEKTLESEKKENAALRKTNDDLRAQFLVASSENQSLKKVKADNELKRKMDYISIENQMLKKQHLSQDGFHHDIQSQQTIGLPTPGSGSGTTTVVLDGSQHSQYVRPSPTLLHPLTSRPPFSIPFTLDAARPLQASTNLLTYTGPFAPNSNFTGEGLSNVFYQRVSEAMSSNQVSEAASPSQFVLNSYGVTGQGGHVALQDVAKVSSVDLRPPQHFKTLPTRNSVLLTNLQVTVPPISPNGCAQTQLQIDR